MAEAKKNCWTVISMKDDWKAIFPLEKNWTSTHARPILAGRQHWTKVQWPSSTAKTTLLLQCNKRLAERL